MAEASDFSSHLQAEFEPSTPQERHPYRRQGSWMSPKGQYLHVNVEDEDGTSDDDLGAQRSSYGLGLSGIPSSSTSPTIKRVAVGSRDSISGAMPGSVSPEISEGRLSQNTTAHNTPGDLLSPKSIAWANISQTGSQTSIPQPYEPSSDETHLLSSHVSAPCPTRGDVLRGRWSWFSITILTLAAYSTAFSAVFLIIALVKPRWGQRVGTEGHISYSTATLLSALLAKTIELSFATVFVALLGQVLSRRAFAANVTNGGISIAEMNMRSWIMQPGTLFTNWMGVRYALTTMLGLVALLAAVTATFYTTAAEALVAPKPKMGPWETHTLGGRVAASYANSPYLTSKCQSPILLSDDPQYKGTSCLQIDYAGRSFHNLKTYMSSWTEVINTGNSTPKSASFAGRPPPVALMYDNTTVLGQWLDVGNTTELSKQFDRLVLNVTMAMPHANIFSAVRDPVNHILQPEDLQGNGEYYVRAAVPVPALNVICAGLQEAEVNTTFIGNKTVPPPGYRKSEVFNTIFEFDAIGDDPPLFQRLPIPYNTVANVTETWGPTSIYLLAAAPPTEDNFFSDNDYVICGMKSMQYSRCTTMYHVAQSGGQLSVHCGDDPQNTIPYIKHDKKAPVSGLWEKNWKDIGAEWHRSVSLNQGMSSSNASVARILTQMIPAYNKEQDMFLSTSEPTIGEALGVLGGATLLLSSEDSPFIHYWNYSETVSVLEEPQLQYFEAELRFRDYASGGTQNWQSLFYLILVATFLLNCFALAYLAWNFVVYGQVTDFTEPQNLFALAINSPPSRNMAGACGGGPSGNVLAKKWTVNMQEAPTGNENDHPHFYVQYRDEREDYSPSSRRRNPRGNFGTTIRSWKNQLSSIPSGHAPLSPQQTKAIGRPRSIFETDGRESPAVEQYKRLSAKAGPFNKRSK